MIGCHNCKNKPLPGTKYERSKCAGCRTKKEPHRVRIYDPELKERDMSVEPEVYQINMSESEKDQMFHALGRLIDILFQIRLNSKSAFNIVRLKLTHPEYPYAVIAAKLECKKQNVAYHLERAMKAYPELKSALLIDSRFSRGCSIKKKV